MIAAAIFASFWREHTRSSAGFTISTSGFEFSVHTVPDFCYHQTMTIGIAGPGRKAPGQNAVVGFIIAAVVVGICLILLRLASDFLVDWLWFSSIGYLQVFLTSIGAKAVVFFAVLTATAVILWLNGLLAVRFARRQPTQARRLRVETHGQCAAARSCSRSCAIDCRGRGLSQAVQVCSLCWSPRQKPATGASSCSFSITCHMAQTIRSTTRTSASISSHCPPISSSRTGCCSRSF